MWIGHILRSTCGGCGVRRGIPVMVAQGEAIPVMGAFGGPLREEMLAQARKDICGNYDL